MAGAIRLGELCHLMESRIEAALESGEYTEDLFSWLEERMDRLSSDVERLRHAPDVTSPLAAVPAGAPVAAAPAALAEPRHAPAAARRRAPSRRFRARPPPCASTPTRSTT